MTKLNRKKWMAERQELVDLVGSGHVDEQTGLMLKPIESGLFSELRAMQIAICGDDVMAPNVSELQSRCCVARTPDVQKRIRSAIAGLRR